MEGLDQVASDKKCKRCKERGKAFKAIEKIKDWAEREKSLPSESDFRDGYNSAIDDVLCIISSK